jgi:predicted MFS family arabinose efflux permease
MTATSFVLATSEFLPPSLLPAMAAALGVSEGQAGQTVTVTAFAGLVSAPIIGTLFPHLGRRSLLVGLTAGAVASNVVVAITENMVILLLARLLLGAAIGGFWAMSLAVAARVSAPHDLARSITLVNLGASLATVVGVPVGIWLGSIFDWRLVFVGVAGVTLCTAVAVRVALPAVPSDGDSGLRALRDTLRTPGVAMGLAGHTLTMLSNFAAFTYIRPVLALTPGLEGASAAPLIGAFGLSSVIGGILTGALVDRHLRVLRFAQPFMLAASLGTLWLFSGQLPIVVAAILVWGLVFGGWLVVVSAWVGRLVPSRMEAGGGLVVAGYQFAIALGAGIGGVFIDQAGISLTLVIAAGSALLGGVLFGFARQDAVRSESRRS